MSEPDANGWHDIDADTPPVEDLVDIWVAECDYEGDLSKGHRRSEVRILHTWQPIAFEFLNGSGYWEIFNPDENGQWITHWRPAPKPPVSSEAA